MRPCGLCGRDAVVVNPDSGVVYCKSHTLPGDVSLTDDGEKDGVVGEPDQQVVATEAKKEDEHARDNEVGAAGA